MKSAAKCNVCGQPLHDVILEINVPDRFERYAGISGNNYQRFWLSCSNCGVYCNISGEGNWEKLDQIASEYYAIDLSHSSIEQKYETVMKLPAQKSDNAQRVHRIREFLGTWFPQTGTIKLSVLDIGAGTGVFLSRLIQNDSAQVPLTWEWTATAVESDPIAAKHLRNLNKFTVLERQFQRSHTMGKFHLCTLNKVLEHIIDPIGFLKEVASCMSTEDGLLYVEVPDKLTAHLREPHDNILGPLHHNLFDIRSLAHVIEKSGLSILRSERIIEPSGKISVFAIATHLTALENRWKTPKHLDVKSKAFSIEDSSEI